MLDLVLVPQLAPDKSLVSCLKFVFILKMNIFQLVSASTKKAKKAKEPEAPVLYDDPPDRLTSKDGRAANLKITSWNVDGLRAWVKKKGLDVSLL